MVSWVSDPSETVATGVRPAAERASSRYPLTAPGGALQPSATVDPETCAVSPVGAAGGCSRATTTVISFDAGPAPDASNARTRMKYVPGGTPGAVSCGTAPTATSTRSE